MDPDAALARFYAARRKAQEEMETAAKLHESVHENEIILMEAVEAAADLFEWMAKGGFPPDWSAPMLDVPPLSYQARSRLGMEGPTLD